MKRTPTIDRDLWDIGSAQLLIDEVEVLIAGIANIKSLGHRYAEARAVFPDLLTLLEEISEQKFT